MAAPGGQLILTVTRACNLRCTYCPTAKDGWPDLSAQDAIRGLRLFVERFGGGDVKLFGGEPLLVPEVVRAVVEESARLDAVQRVYLSTNGLGLDSAWLDTVRRQPKLVLTLSMDGDADDHRRFRRALPGVGDSYGRILELLPELLATPRVVVTQTIPPPTAHRADANLRHLLALGFTRFNLLPGYYLPWQPGQLEGLRAAFGRVAELVRERWARGEAFYLRNLFTRAPTPFFNAGLIVDADGSLHPSNVGLSGRMDDAREVTRVGTLDDPPTPEALHTAAARVNLWLETNLPPRVWESTLAVDRELTALCEALYPAFFAMRARRRQPAAHVAAP